MTSSSPERMIRAWRRETWISRRTVREKLRVTCTDSAGKPIDGLAPGALEVTDAGARVGYLMRQNSGASPRVAFLLDETLSQPAAFVNAAQRTALGVSIGQALYATFPGALVQVTALSGTAPDCSGALFGRSEGQWWQRHGPRKRRCSDEAMSPSAQKHAGINGGEESLPFSETTWATAMPVAATSPRARPATAESRCAARRAARGQGSRLAMSMAKGASAR